MGFFDVSDQSKPREIDGDEVKIGTTQATDEDGNTFTTTDPKYLMEKSLKVSLNFSKISIYIKFYNS